MGQCLVWREGFIVKSHEVPGPALAFAVGMNSCLAFCTVVLPNSDVQRHSDEDSSHAPSFNTARAGTPSLPLALARIWLALDREIVCNPPFHAVPSMLGPSAASLAQLHKLSSACLKPWL